MGAARLFVDTNVLHYSIDLENHAKQRQANHWMSLLWATGSGRLSWQVLHEFYSNIARKFRSQTETGRGMVETLSQWRPGEMSFGVIERGWHWMETAQLSY